MRATRSHLLTTSSRLLTGLRLALVVAVAVTLAISATSGSSGSSGSSGMSGSARPSATTTAALLPVKKDVPANPVTPGNFTGYAFDQCLAPSQSAMNAWLNYSPFFAAGIYISGNSRACRSQPNLTPAWIHTQLQHGWRLLPLTMGPQASCNPRFPRYSDDPKINPTTGSSLGYSAAHTQARNTAKQTVADAKALGIVPGSTLWYDMEGFDAGNTPCRESALNFLSGWTSTLHRLGYKSGVYSSVSSGIKALDDARVSRPGAFTMPDQIWLARWDGVANTSSSYIRSTGWTPGGRVKQYQGGHNESWGGVTINIDRSYLDLGAGSKRAAAETHCGGVGISFKNYQPLSPAQSGAKLYPAQVKALQCLLKERAGWDGKISGTYTSGTAKAVRAWQHSRGFNPDPKGRWFRRDWMSILSVGEYPVLKIGSVGGYVRRVQRALNASGYGYDLDTNGVYDSATLAAVRSYQLHVKAGVSGVVNGPMWAKLVAGAH